MGFAKSPPELISRFQAALPKHPDAEPRQMFGYPCCFVRGNFWVGLHEGNVAIRLPDGLDAKFPALKGARPFDPMGGRPMKGWFVVPPAVAGDEAKLRALLEATFPEVMKLPAKAKAARRTQKPGPTGKAPAQSGTKRPARKPTKRTR